MVNVSTTLFQLSREKTTANERKQNKCVDLCSVSCPSRVFSSSRSQQNRETVTAEFRVSPALPAFIVTQTSRPMKTGISLSLGRGSRSDPIRVPRSRSFMFTFSPLLSRDWQERALEKKLRDGQSFVFYLVFPQFLVTYFQHEIRFIRWSTHSRYSKSISRTVGHRSHDYGSSTTVA